MTDPSVHSEALVRAMEHAASITMVLDEMGNISSISGAFDRLLGHDPAGAIGRQLGSFAVPGGATELADAIERTRAGLRTVTCEAMMLTTSPEQPSIPLRFEFVNLLADPVVAGLVVTAHDIRDLYGARRTLEHLARHDALTGLANRTLLLDRLEDLLRRGRQAAVVFIDLDRFKPVNDVFGHEAGDQLLRQVADRLNRIVRPEDLVARVGGDEFVVLAASVSERQGAIQLADRIDAALANPYLLDEGPLRVTASVGVSMTDPGATVTGVLTDADLAMYEAKAARRGEPARALPKRHRKADERRQLADDLSLGLRRGEVVAHFQPLVDMATGATLGFEALARWQHPVLGLLAPGEFLDIAEDAGVDPLLGDVVLRAACQVAATLPPPLHVAVNLSATQLADRHLASRVGGILADHGVPPERIIVEITERATLARRPGAGRVSPDETLLALYRMGIMLSLDDFGTGYSSLTHIRNYPLSIIKVDRSFVARAREHREDRAVIAAVVGMAEALDLLVVAEGVETEEHLSDLRDIGCDMAQGYLVARPFPAEQVADWVAHRGADWRSVQT